MNHSELIKVVQWCTLGVLMPLKSHQVKVSVTADSFNKSYYALRMILDSIRVK